MRMLGRKKSRVRKGASLQTHVKEDVAMSTPSLVTWEPQNDWTVMMCTCGILIISCGENKNKNKKTKINIIIEKIPTI